MPSRHDIIDTARSYLGTPFHHQGRVKGIGIDCVGLLVCVARDLGLPHYDVAGYPRLPRGNELEGHLDANLDVIDGIEPACVLLMAFDSDPQHTAICSSEESIIHAYLDARKCAEHALDEKWRSRIRKIYRFRGLT